ncbi:right-handed parallel beta-helix repeat-containing protein [Streptomyces bungoensis]|uniref:right-handed parallel beta-helix repeat-containing protein n=1 Tax=Streptomyces bungoensis TaxID=285568 RepID=UPI00343F7239
MRKCHIAYLACTAALVGAGLGAAPAAAGQASPRLDTTYVVSPGQSIQKAVDAAQPGDTVLVLAGTYHESVTIGTPGLTLRGVGPETVIKPGAKKKTKKKTATTTAAKSADSCAEGGNGICVIGTKAANVRGVTVANLTVTGFSRTGVFGMATDSMTVRGVYAVKNGVWGIAQERSVGGFIGNNHARDNGDAGVFLANTIKEEAGAYDAGQTLVEGNRIEGNRIGVTVRRLRDLTVAGNYISGNCAGVFVVGDENKPKAGDLAVAANRIVRNNKSCPATERLPALQGSGIVLTGTERTRVTGNLVTGNTGASPLSGGIVLFKSFVGVTSNDNRVDRNMLRNNTPADLVNTDPGKGNAFDRNTCRASRPAGLC